MLKMSGKEMDTKEQPSATFSITSIRNSILQKIQQSSQNCPEGESRQPIRSEVPSAASDREITEKCFSVTCSNQTHSWCVTCGEPTDSLCTCGGRLLPVDAATEPAVRHSEEERDWNSTDETNSSIRLDQVLPTNLENDAGAKTQDILLMLETKNAEVHMDNDTPTNKDSAKSCTSQQVHLCKAADCESSSNVSDMKYDQSENEKVPDLGKENSPSCDRQLGNRECAFAACQEDNDIAVSEVEKLEERFEEEKKMQWDDADITITKEEYQTLDSNSQCGDADIAITKEEYRTQGSNSECEDEEAHSPDSDTDTSSLSDEDQGGLATKKKGYVHSILIGNKQGHIIRLARNRVLYWALFGLTLRGSALVSAGTIQLPEKA